MYLQQVQQEFASVASVQAVPSYLTPDLTSAGTDHPETSSSPEDCMASFLEVEQGGMRLRQPDQVGLPAD